jgi:hypothetical protein
MNSFVFAGEVVVSELPLGLGVSSSPTDVTIVIETGCRQVRPDFTDYVVRGLRAGQEWALGRATGSNDWHFHVAPYATGTITADGTRIVVRPAPTVTASTLAELITTWILVYRLAVLDRWSFHGSAVRLTDGDALVVLGPSGAGKTSTAAALIAAGCELIADDTVAGGVDGDIAWIAPTSTTLRLRYHARQLVPAMNPTATFVADDDRLIVAVRPASAPTPARCLAFLRRGTGDTAVEHLRPDQVVQRLLLNSKIATWWDDRYRAHEFEAACDLADKVPAFEIAGPDACRDTDDFAEFADQLLRIIV